MKKNKIIVIGAGYAGLQAVEHLAKEKNNEIALFDRHPYHYMQTEVYDFIANENDFAKITVDLFTFALGFDGNVTFHKQEIKNIDFENKRIISHVQRYSYDYLVIAVGAKTKVLDSIPGLREYSHGVKSLKRALYFKQKFESSLFKKIEDEGKQCTPLNIVVAGGGLSGVEIAAQMASFSKDFYKENHFLCRKLNIVLVNSSAKVLKGVDENLVDLSMKKLSQLGIIIKNNARVTEVRKEEVLLSTQEVVPMDFMIFTGGVEPSPIVKELSISKNVKGYIETNQFLQTKEYEDVFAIGDCTTIYKDDKPVAPTADIAEQMGKICAHNINALIQKQPMKKHNINSRGLLIAIGRKYTVGKVFGFYFSGRLAFLIKKAVERTYAYNLDKRARKGCEKIFADS